MIPDGVSPERKHLLLVDGHSSVCTKGALYGIDIGLLPNHTSHRMLYLNVSVFKSFKSHFANIEERFINANPAWSNGNFDKSYLVELPSNALKEALLVSNIQAELRKTRIFPLNPCYGQ